MTRTERFERWLISRIGRVGAFVVMTCIQCALTIAIVIDCVALVALIGAGPALWWTDTANHWFLSCLGYGAIVCIVGFVAVALGTEAWDKWNERYPSRKTVERGLHHD